MKSELSIASGIISNAIGIVLFLIDTVKSG